VKCPKCGNDDHESCYEIDGAASIKDWICADCYVIVQQEVINQLRSSQQWQTGIMPKEGWYWIREDPSEPDCISPFCEYTSDVYLYMHLQWAGPLEPPTDKE
jgi:hypothetical protein